MDRKLFFRVVLGAICVVCSLSLGLWGCVSGGRLNLDSASREPATNSPSDLRPLDLYGLKTLLLTRPKIRTIADFIDVLKEEYPDFLTHYASMYRSVSLQAATFEAPRLILYGRAGRRLILTLNGDPSQKGYDALEAMEYSEATGDIKLQEFIFKLESAEQKSYLKRQEIEQSNDRLIVSKINPGKCLQCHIPDPVTRIPRFLWDAYPLWPGARFGHGDDPDSPRVMTSTGQLRGPYQQLYARFEYAKVNHPRYRHFPDRPMTRRSLNPNTDLTNIAEQVNYQRIVRAFEMDRQLRPYLKSIIFDQLCDPYRVGRSRAIPRASGGVWPTGSDQYRKIWAQAAESQYRYTVLRLQQLVSDLRSDIEITPGIAQAQMEETNRFFSELGVDFLPTENDAISRVSYNALGVLFEHRRVALLKNIFQTIGLDVDLWSTSTVIGSYVITSNSSRPLILTLERLRRQEPLLQRIRPNQLVDPSYPTEEQTRICNSLTQVL